MSNLYVVPFAQTSEERIQSQIDNFRKLFITQSGDFDLDYCNQMIDIIIEYLAQFDDDDVMLNQAYVRLQEAHFWLDSSIV